jgi:hypothetical protein
MGSAKRLEAGGKKVVLIDISGADMEEMIRVFNEAKGLIRSEPEGSVLTLTDATGAHPTPAITRHLKEFVRGNSPYVKAGAIVGVSALMKPIYVAVMTFANRKIPPFATREEALQWLLSQ